MKYRLIGDLPITDRIELTEDELLVINKAGTNNEFQKLTVGMVLEKCPDELLIKHIESRGYKLFIRNITTKDKKS